ncbi:MAG: alkaline phosphatase family protein [Balneolaceae bacterium]|nr:alkaline phosphatase family protein [Balneolaceae bacterium]
MKTFAKLLSFLLASFLLFWGCEQPSEPEKKAIYIIVDGISADILESVDTPNLDRIIEQGGYTHGWLGGIAGEYSESTTISAVGYNHVLTGVWSNKHNVYTNSIEDPNYNYWSLFRLFKHNHPEKPVAIYSSWLDNRTKLVGDGLPEAGGINIDIHYDGFDVDTLAFPHEYGYVQKIDEHVSNNASESLREDAPYLSWVYLWYPDDTGHTYGEVEEHFESIKVADEQVGRIYEAVEYRMENYNEDWLFMVTTDHGRRLPDGRHHGGQSERERTIWMISNKSDMNRFFDEGHPPITSIYPTISRHLGLDIPAALKKELDGVPMIGDVSISDPEISYDEETQTIDLNWNAWGNDGDVNIKVAVTNEFSGGGEDQYELLETVPLSAGQASMSVAGHPSDFYKVLLEAPHNSVNRWLVLDDENDED